MCQGKFEEELRFRKIQNGVVNLYWGKKYKYWLEKNSIKFCWGKKIQKRLGKKDKIVLEKIAK